jgi:hypothetical protein
MKKVIVTEVLERTWKRENQKELYYHPDTHTAFISTSGKNTKLYRCTPATQHRISMLTYRDGIRMHLVSNSCVVLLRETEYRLLKN